jgi:hypothetical protein
LFGGSFVPESGPFLPFYRSPLVGVIVHLQTMADTLTVPIAQLKLDAENPQLDSFPKSQRDAHRTMLTLQSEKLLKGEQRQITLSVNDLTVSCRTSYSPSVA